jgi:hypothetical protein
MDVEIDEVVTDLIVTEPNGSLSREEMRNIVRAVAEHLRAQRQSARQREKDTGVRDRAYQPEGGGADEE